MFRFVRIVYRPEEPSPNKKPPDTPTNQIVELCR